MQFLNIIIQTPNVQQTDRTNLFPDEEIVHCVRSDASKDMWDLLVILGVFKSKSMARKNWKHTGKDIPPGWSQFQGLGKHRKELCIWNPTE
jgi:hypothetical protein